MGEQTEGYHKTREQKEIHRPVHEACGEREEEEQREEDADGSDDFGVDEALLVPCRLALILVQVFASEASNGGCES